MRFPCILLLAIMMVIAPVSQVLSAEEPANLVILDAGRRTLPNSNVRYITMLGTGTEDDPFVIWYEDWDSPGYLKRAASTSNEDAFMQGSPITMDGEPVVIKIQGRENNFNEIGRPAVLRLPFSAPKPFGMYFREIRDGETYLSFSTSNNGIEWSYPQRVEGVTAPRGAVDALLVDGEVRLYWVDEDSRLRVSVSPAGSFTHFPGTAPVLLGGMELRPTGQVIRAYEGYYLFFVTKNEPVYAGLAYSPDGLNNWRVVRDAADPILTNASAEREELHQLTASNGGLVYKMFYTATFREEEAVPAGGMTMTMGVPEDDSDSSVGFAKGLPGTVHLRKNPKGNHVGTFREALLAVAPGGQIKVGSGTYEESVTVNKPVSIMANDPAQPLPVLSFAGKPYGFKIEADNVTIENMAIRGNGTGQALFSEGRQLQNITFAGLEISAVTNAAYFAGRDGNAPVRNLTFAGCLFAGLSGDAVYLRFVDGARINDSTFKEYFPNKALVAMDTLKTVNARRNKWNTGNPGQVIAGNVDFDAWVNVVDAGSIREDGRYELPGLGEICFQGNMLTVTYAAVPKEELPPPPAGRIFTGVNWRIKPEETSFNYQVTIRIVADNVTPQSDFRLYHYNEKTDVQGRVIGWEDITTSVGQGYIEGATNSFSIFAVTGQGYSDYGVNTNLLLAGALALVAAGLAMLLPAGKARRRAI